jgi:hypothetical protein
MLYPWRSSCCGGFLISSPEPPLLIEFEGRFGECFSFGIVRSEQSRVFDDGNLLFGEAPVIHGVHRPEYQFSFPLGTD